MESLKSKVGGVLRSSERFLKLDMVYVAKGGLWTSISFLVGLGASTATMVAFGNLLSKENYGTYNYLLSLAASLGFLTLSGIGPTLTRAVAQKKERLIPYALKLQLRYNLLAVATIAAVGTYYFAKGNMLFATALFVLSIVIPLSSAYHIHEQVLIGRKWFGTLSLISSLFALVSSAATIITVSLTDSVLPLIYTYSFISLVPSILIYYAITRRIEDTPVTKEDKMELKNSALHITGAGLIGALVQYADKILLFQVAGPASLATYGFAIAGPERLKGVIKNWVSIALPRLSNRSLEEIDHSFYKRIGISMLLGTALAAVYILCAPFLFTHLLPKYLDSVAYSQLYALGLIFIPTLTYIGNIFYSQNMLRAIYIISTGNQIVRVVLVLLFGWLWQTWGLVIGFVLSQAIGTLLYIIIWKIESGRLRNLI